ncbi:outer membrane beta-barrel protein [Hymenobacter negativus]|uniref:PorT family protein n=1 Tax=Hymenobacter negativus TaxID=2795026 RepID=A0ABS3QLI7_9BACT|nr:outer membrane beta-barrel protein [Hymenobacter negativus]MBO2011843.1 PorT family protein [Hymenobacter negativus]
MRNFTLFLLITGLNVSLVQAQTSVSFGPRLGGNLSTATFSSLEQTTGGSGTLTSSSTPLLGWQIGMAASFGKGPWMVQPALIFTQKGVKQKASASDSFGSQTLTATIDATSRVNFLELPVNVVYAFGADGQGFQVFAGPYLAIGVGGKAEISEKLTSSDPNSLFNGEGNGSKGYAFGNTFVEPDPNSPNDFAFDARVRRFDAGANLGVGYRTGPFQVQLSYAFGLLNAQPDYPVNYQIENTTGYHRNTQLTATYFLPQFSR